jgi:gliding motility-associated-like protein
MPNPLRVYLLFAAMLLGLAHQASAQFTPPAKQWERAFGTSGYNYLYQSQQTADGGYILGGTVPQAVLSSVNQFAPDYWVVKLNAVGTKEWERTFAGRGIDEVHDVRQTTDGGYIVGGSSGSPVSADKSQGSRGSIDYWVIKLDANGNKQWDKTFGGDDVDVLQCVRQTADGGYLLAGSSQSSQSGDKSQGTQGNFDYWVVKLDANGAKQWDHTFGGSDRDDLFGLQQTADQGYIIGGYSLSGASGSKSQASRGGYDYWVVKLDANGQKQWDKTYGGTDNDYLYALVQTTDGGYMLGGVANSGQSGDKSQPRPGGYWVLKLAANGAKQWDRTYSGNGGDILQSLQQTADGGYLFGGASLSGAAGDKTEPGRGGNDYWIIKTDLGGTKEWDRTAGGSDIDNLTSVQQTTDGGYLLGGASTSGASGDKSQASYGEMDFWIVKLDAGIGMPPSSPQRVQIRGDNLLCNGGRVVLTAYANPVAISWLWSTGATTASISVAQPGIYSVTATFADGSNSTTQYQVYSFVPAIAVAGDTVFCVGSVAQLSANAPNASAYRWSNGATTSTITVAQPGTYAVTAFYGSGCAISSSIRIRQIPPIPAFTLGRDTTLCEGASLVLRAPSAAGAGVAYRWSDGSTGSTLRVSKPGTYALQVSLPNAACAVRTASLQVALLPCLTIPNIITPNADGVNDQFEISGLVGAGWQLAIYNRWGRAVYQTESYHNDWGQQAAPGIYYYLLRRAATQSVYKGWVEVNP